MKTLSHCPNCNTKIKTGLLANNELYSDKYMAFIDAFCSQEHAHLCFSCGVPFLEEARKNLRYERNKVKKMQDKLVDNIPIVSIESPMGWKYKTLGLVSEKLKVTVRLDGTAKISEDNCFNLLKLKAYELGGNAIVGARVHYSTYPNVYYLLINTFGTAVEVSDQTIFSDQYQEALDTLSAYKDMVDLVRKFDHIRLV